VNDPHLPRDIELLVNRHELSVLLDAVWIFVSDPGVVHRDPGKPLPTREWIEAEFRAQEGFDIGVGEALRERLLAIKRQVDAQA